MAFITSTPPASLGAVSGPPGTPSPGSSTDNAVVRWDGTTGNSIQNSGVILDDSNNLSGINSLTVSTLMATTTVTTGDNIIRLNDDVVGAPTENAGIEIERGSSTDAQLLWNETTDRWQAGLSGSLQTLAFTPAWSIVSTSGTINDLAITTDAIRFTGVSVIVRGIVPSGIDGQEITVHNATGSLMQVLCESGTSAAANRFTSSTNIGFQIQSLQSMQFKYSTATSRWLMAVPQPIYIHSATPLTVNANNGLIMSEASSSLPGWLSAGNFNIFNNKLSGAGNTDDIPFYASSNSLTYAPNNDFVYKSTTRRMGIQQATPLASSHIRSVIEEGPPNPGSLIATRVLFTPSSTPSGSTAIQQPGHLMHPNSPSATENSSGGTSYLTGDTLDYKIVPYNFDGDVTYTECVSGALPAQVVMAADNNGVDVSWSPDASGTATISGYLVYRSFNSSGFTTSRDIGGSTSFTDDSTSWVAQAYPTYPLYVDFVATSAARAYRAYSKDTVSGPGDYYSASFEAYGFTDDGSGKAFRVTHTVSTGSTSARVLGHEDGVAFTKHVDGKTFEEYPDTWVSGAVVTPSILGYQSDGAYLTRDYRLHSTNTISGIPVYSAANVNSSITDPNDSLYYYVQLDWTVSSGGTGWKLLVDRDVVDGSFDDAHQEVTGSTSGSFYDTAESVFDGTTTITPTGVVSAVQILEKDGAGSVSAHQLIKGTDNSSRIDFVSSADAVQLSVKSNATEATLTYGAGNPLLRMESNKLAFYNVAAIARPTTGVASATIVGGAGTTVKEDHTFDGYTIAQVVKALRLLGVLT